MAKDKTTPPEGGPEAPAVKKVKSNRIFGDGETVYVCKTPCFDSAKAVYFEAGERVLPQAGIELPWSGDDREPYFEKE